MSTAKFIIQICKGLVRDQRSRRTLMFYSVLIALEILFAGATVLDGPLRAHPLIFLGYWGVCTWITLLAVLLAIFDLLMVRAAARRVQRRLEEEVFLAEKLKQPHDPNPR